MPKNTEVLKSKKEPEHLLAPLKDLDQWARNPRGVVNRELLGDLEHSIAVNGILVPLIVRRTENKKLEVIAGNRRLEAALSVSEYQNHLTRKKVEMIPVIVYDSMTDQEATEIAILENVQRENLTPVEEAEAYQYLFAGKIDGKMESFQLLEEISSKTGKSVGHIKKRLLLLQLNSEGKKALRDGKFTLGAAVAIASIPDPRDREDAVKRAIRNCGNSVFAECDAREMIDNNYSFILSAAGWKWSDPFEDQQKSPGPCEKCSMNSASQNELFSDVAKGKPRCMNGRCFEARKAVYLKRMLESAKKEKREVITGHEAEAAIQGWGSRYTNLKNACEEDPKKRSYLRILKDSGSDLVPALAVDPKGKSAEVLRTDQLEATLRKLKIIRTATSSASPSEKREREKDKINRKALDIALQKIRGKALEFSPSLYEKWIKETALREILMAGNDVSRIVCKARGIEGKKTDYGLNYSSVIEGLGESIVTIVDLVALQAEVRAAQGVFSANDFHSDDTEGMLKFFGLDWKSCVSEAANSCGKGKASKAPEAAKPKKALKKKGGKK